MVVPSSEPLLCLVRELGFSEQWTLIVLLHWGLIALDGRLESALRWGFVVLDGAAWQRLTLISENSDSGLEFQSHFNAYTSNNTVCTLII